MKFHINGQEREATRKGWPQLWGEETGHLYEIQGQPLSPGDEVQWSGELPPLYTLWVMVHVQLREGAPATTGYLRLTRSDFLL